MDLNIVLSNFNKTYTGDAWTFGDFDGNDTVNGADLNTVLSNFNKTFNATAPCARTVHPPSAAAVLLGLWPTVGEIC